MLKIKVSAFCSIHKTTEEAEIELAGQTCILCKQTIFQEEIDNKKVMLVIEPVSEEETFGCFIHLIHLFMEDSINLQPDYHEQMELVTYHFAKKMGKIKYDS